MDKQVQGGFARDIAMDLGTTSVLVAVRGRGILLQEPSVVAVDRRTGAVLQVGEAARQMLGRTPGDLLAVRPLREGIISDCTIAEAMVRAFLHKAAPGRLLKPRLLVCVPSGISEVAERAVVEAGLQAGARTAEEVKEAIGRVDGPGEETLAVKGRCLNTGLPREILLSGEETAEAFTPVAENIISAVQAVLERTPPELAADVAVSGILLTGGGSLLQGMDTLLAARTGMETHLAEDPIRAVALGLEQTLPHLAKRQEGVLNLARRRQLTV